MRLLYALAALNLVLLSLLVVSLSSSSLRGDAQTWYILSAVSALTTAAFALWKQVFSDAFPGAAFVPTQLFAVMPIIVGWQSRIAGDTTSSPLHNALFGIALVLLGFVFLMLEKTSELALVSAKGGKAPSGSYPRYNSLF